MVADECAIVAKDLDVETATVGSLQQKNPTSEKTKA